MQPATVLVVDFGAQYAQLIARRVREAQVYSEIVPSDTSVADIVARKPAAVILSGGPASVYADGAPSVDPALFKAGIPVLGLCYGFQAMAEALGGEVAPDGTREYGRTELTLAGGPAGTDAGVLHQGLPARHPVWMSHGDSVVRAPEGFTVTASSERASVAAFEDVERRLAGVQYHPEVGHSPHGQEVLRRFLREIAGVAPSWTTTSIIADTVAGIRAQVGTGRAICG
ncbi:MAG TPA: glutamine-hydrolyzing GMP synthase, partial [Pseudonocardia sp.]